MSGADPTLLLNANHGNLANLLVSQDSIWENRGYDTSNIFAQDNTFYSLPVNTQATFGGEDRFRLRKRGGRIAQTWIKLYVSAGVVAAANRAAFSDDFGASVVNTCRVEYASKVLHDFRGEPVKAYNRLVQHDIAREAYFAMAFAGLPPGTGGSEAQRELNASSAFIAFVPLSWFWFTRGEDYAFTPESLASEVDLIVGYQQLARMVYARVIATGLAPTSSPFTTAPAITRAELYTQLIHAPGPEKTLHLSKFEGGQGQIYKILDIEEQRQLPVSNTAQTISLKLDNFRLDSQFVIFFMRDINVNTDWTLDNMQSDITATILSGGGSVNGLLPITSFRLIANGKPIVDTCTDIENRSVWRNMYFPGSQIAEPIYFIPFAQALRDARNIAGFQNLSNLGNIELELTVPASTNARIVDAYNFCHNVVQSKKGDIIKALR